MFSAMCSMSKHYTKMHMTTDDDGYGHIYYGVDDLYVKKSMNYDDDGVYAIYVITTRIKKLTIHMNDDDDCVINYYAITKKGKNTHTCFFDDLDGVNEIYYSNDSSTINIEMSPMSNVNNTD